MSNEKTKICKHCKMEIPAGAKICPHCRKETGRQAEMGSSGSRCDRSCGCGF